MNQAQLAAAADQLEKRLAHAIDAGLASGRGKDREGARQVACELLKARRLATEGKHAEASERVAAAAITLDQAIHARGLWWRMIRSGAFVAAYLALGVVLVLVIAAGWRPGPLDRLTQTDFWGVPLAALGWGALGSLLRSLYWLPRQVDREVYRPLFALGHLCAPFIGALFGAFIFLLLNAGLFVLDANAEVSNPAVPLALAFLAGFNWETVLEWVERFRMGAAESKTKKAAASLEGANNAPKTLPVVDAQGETQSPSGKERTGQTGDKTPNS